MVCGWLFRFAVLLGSVGRSAIVVAHDGGLAKAIDAKVAEGLSHGTPPPPLPRAGRDPRGRRLHEPGVESEHEVDDAETPDHCGEETTVAVAYLLLGFMVSNFILIWLVNYPDENVRESVWNMMSSTISIYLAVLTYTYLTTQIEFLFLQMDEHGHKHHTDQELPLVKQIGKGVIETCLFVAAIFAANYLCYHCDTNSRPKYMYASKVIGGHIVAFSGIGLYRYFCSLLPLSHVSLVMRTVVAAIPIFVLLGALRFWTRVLRDRFGEKAAEDNAKIKHSDPAVRYRLLRGMHSMDLARTEQESGYRRAPTTDAKEEQVLCERDNVDGKELGKWRDCVCEAEDDGSAIIASYVTYKVVLAAVTKTSTHDFIEKKKEEVLRADATLFAIVLCFVMLIFIGTFVKRKIETRFNMDTYSSTHFAVRGLQVAQLTCNLSMSWFALLLFQSLLNYFFQKAPNELLEIGTAAVITLAAILTILVLDHFADRLLEGRQPSENEDAHHHHTPFSFVNTERAVRMVITCWALAVGLSWESAFHAAVGIVVESNTFMEQHYVVSRGLMALLNILVIMPPWLEYIVPNATKTADDHKELMERAKDM